MKTRRRIKMSLHAQPLEAIPDLTSRIAQASFPKSTLAMHLRDALGPIYGVAPEVVAKAGEYFREQLRHVEVALADGRPFLMGDSFTSADILLTTCLDWAIAYGVGICDNAHPYLERIQAREAYQLAQAANVPLAPTTPVQAKI